MLYDCDYTCMPYPLGQCIDSFDNLNGTEQEVQCRKSKGGRVVCSHSCDEATGLGIQLSNMEAAV